MQKTKPKLQDRITMTYLIEGLSYLFGLQFIVFGCDGFFHFLPPFPIPAGIKEFVAGLEKSKFVMPTVKAIEILAGLMCFFPSTRMVALLLFAPLIYNITGLHIVHNRQKAWIVILQVTVPFIILSTLTVTHY